MSSKRFFNSGAGIAAAILVATFALYWRSVHYEFIQLDDPLYVTENPQVKAGLTATGSLWALTTTAGGNWNPVVWLSYMTTCELFGTTAGPQRLVNIALHSINSVLLFYLLASLTNARWRSALVAALFALHPLHIESVIWVSERKDVLSTLFFTTALLCYSRFATARSCQSSARGWYLLLLTCFLLGLMSKPMLVTLPFVCLLLDFWPLCRIPTLNKKIGLRPYLPLLLEKIPLFGLSALFCILTLWAQSREQAVATLDRVDLLSRISNAAISYSRYLGKTFWPDKFAIFYPLEKHWDTATTLQALFVLLVVSVVAVLARKRHPFLFTGWFWFLGTLMPVIGLVQVGTQAMADRYMYIPMVGLCIAISWALAVFAARNHIARTVAISCAFIMCCAAFLRSQAQIKVWRTSESVFLHAMSVTTNSSMALLNLAYDAAARGTPEGIKKAEALYREILASQPRNVDARNNLGRLLADRGETNEAFYHWDYALRVAPRNVATHNNLGTMYLSLGDLAKAEHFLSNAIELSPDKAEPRASLGALRAQQGRLEEAQVLFEESVKLNPGSAEFRFNLGSVLRLRGDPAQACSHLETAVRLRPDYAKAHYELGMLLVDQNSAEAGTHLRQAADLGFRVPEARQRLASLAIALGDTAAATNDYRRALEGDPNFVSSLNDLSWLLATCPDGRFRNGKEAVFLGERAVAITRSNSMPVLDTLAAAYAEAGDFERAAAIARQLLAASRQATNTAAIGKFETRLRLYESRQPYREE